MWSFVVENLIWLKWWFPLVLRCVKRLCMLAGCLPGSCSWPVYPACFDGKYYQTLLQSKSLDTASCELCGCQFHQPMWLSIVTTFSCAMFCSSTFDCIYWAKGSLRRNAIHTISQLFECYIWLCAMWLLKISSSVGWSIHLLH